MPQVVTQLIVDASGAKLGVAEFQRAMSDAQRAAIEGGHATATSFERTQQAWTKSLGATDPIIKAQIAMERDLARQRAVNADAVRLGIASQEAAARQLDDVRQKHERYIQTVRTGTVAHEQSAKAAGLNRYEILNLSRQLQDVGVSLAGGQSPLVVFTQQGSQILDVFQASGVALRTFFSQAIGWAARFVASTAGVVTGITAIAGAAIYMGTSFAAAQKEIDKALSGAGAASGLTRGGVNRIAEGAAGGGMSIDEARASALEFAKTGKIYEQNINTAVNVTRQFALAMGVDAAEATKTLAAALVDPAKGALELNKAIRFLDADTLNYITTLQSMGRSQEAQNALMLAALPAIQRQAEQAGLLTRAWNAATAAISDYDQRRTRMLARGVESATGIEAGGFTNEERLGRAQERQQRAAGPAARGVPFARREYEDATKEVERLTKAIADLKQESEGAKFAQLSLDAREFGRSVDQTTAQIETLTRGLAKIAEYQAARLNQGMGVDPALERQSQIMSTLLAQSLELQQVEQRRAQVVAENALQYANVGTAVAQVLAQLNAQLPVAQAVGGAAQLQAQYELNIFNAKQQGRTVTEAIAIADAKRALSVAQVNTSLDQQLIALQEQAEVLRGATELDRVRIKAAQDYQKAVEAGGDSLKASAVAAQTIANARTAADAREMANAENEAAAAAQRRAAAANQAAASAAAAARASQEQARWEEKIGFAVRTRFGNAQFWETPERISQFDPAGYTSSFHRLGDPKRLEDQANRDYGSGNWEWSNLKGGQVPIPQPNQRYYNMMSQMATPTDNSAAALNFVNMGLQTKGVEATLQEIIGGALGPLTGQKPSSVLQSLNNLVDQSRRAGFLEQEIAKVKQEPMTLAREAMIQDLTKSLEDLKEAVDKNTNTITDVLSPFFTSDPRRTALGFRAFAGGGIMTADGSLPLRQYAGGGIADSPQFAMFGEGSTAEAYVPVPSGRIEAIVKTPANTNDKQRPINVTINIQGNADAGTVAALRTTAFQQAQAMRRVTG